MRDATAADIDIFVRERSTASDKRNPFPLEEIQEDEDDAIFGDGVHVRTERTRGYIGTRAARDIGEEVMITELDQTTNNDMIFIRTRASKEYVSKPYTLIVGRMDSS